MSELAPMRNTVLVVDDAPDSLGFLTQLIEEAGMTVLIATAGSRAIEILEQVTPDLILMDAVIPGLDGFETTRCIKDNPAWAHIPVIFMTGLTGPEHAVAGFSVGAADYVRKPIVAEELLARMRVQLAHARAASRTQATLDAVGRQIVSVDRDGRLLWSTPQAQALMAELEDGWSARDGTPPEPLRTPLRRLLAGEAAGVRSLRVEVRGGSVELALAGPRRTDEFLVQFFDMRESAAVTLLQERLGLTQRESEVLLWVSYGKPNRVISDILGISPRTVNKHLEQVFAKLGVETRAAAAAISVRTTSR